MKFRAFKSITRGILFVLALSWSAVRDPAHAQTGGGYINYGQIQGEPLNLSLDPIDFPQSPSFNNVRAVGMGKAQTADGRFGNGLLANPALLSDEKTRFDVIGLQLNFPKSTFDAASYIKKNAGQFRDGAFLKALGDGFSRYYTAETAAEQQAAIRRINDGLAFPNELYDKIIGDPEAPMAHGLNAIPSIQAQVGHWGFALYGIGQIGFVVNPGEATSRLLTLHVPENTDDLSIEVIKNLAEIIGSVFDEQGNVSPDALPKAFAMSHVDVVGAVGRSFRKGPNLDLGASVKIVNRRFSTKLIDQANLDRVLSDARSELKHTATGLTVDLGLVYRSPKNGARLGVSVLNALPIQTLTSKTTFQFVTPAGAYYVDDGTGNAAVGAVDLEGNFYPDPAGDTLLVVENRDVTVQQPFRLKAPMLANVGFSYPIRPDWDLVLDWVDVFSRDETYKGTAERLRIGTEKRFTGRGPQLALRGGIAEKHLTIGAGLRTRYFQVDLAYARDPFLERGSIFSQIQVGW